MIDKSIDIGTSFDWITPLWSFIQDYRNRPAVGYNVPVDSGWSAYAIRDLLQNAGVKIWGLAIYGNTIVFGARQAQASYIQYLLDREGVPYQGCEIR